MTDIEHAQKEGSHRRGWCDYCCDGSDKSCRCMCHGPWVRWFVKGIIAFVVLVFVFAAGVWVGKLSSWWHSYKYNGYSESDTYQMMRDGRMMQYGNPYQLQR